MVTNFAFIISIIAIILKIFVINQKKNILICIQIFSLIPHIQGCYEGLTL